MLCVLSSSLPPPLTTRSTRTKHTTINCLPSAKPTGVLGYICPQLKKYDHAIFLLMLFCWLNKRHVTENPNHIKIPQSKCITDSTTHTDYRVIYEYDYESGCRSHEGIQSGKAIRQINKRRDDSIIQSVNIWSESGPSQPITVGEQIQRRTLLSGGQRHTTVVRGAKNKKKLTDLLQAAETDGTLTLNSCV